jgi:hypothetical protein
MSFRISKEDFESSKNSHKHKTYKIKCPGTYKLKENISFSPFRNKIAAISIECNDVILDLNGKTLKQSSHNKLSQVIGILVKTGHSNTTILGSYGSVQNFSQIGIYVQGGNNIVTLGDDTLLTVSGCGYGTPVSLLDEQESIVQAGIQLGDMTFLAWFDTGKFYGLLNTVNVTNVIVTQNSLGLALGEGNNFSFNNSSFSQNMENRLINPKFAAPNAGAFFIENSVVCFGMFYFSNPDLPPKPGVPKVYGISTISFQNCLFNSNLADASTSNSGAYPTGLIMLVDFRNLKINDCKFNNNKASFGNEGLGIFNQTRGCCLGGGLGIVIEDSEFSENIGSSLATGFQLTGLISSSDNTRDVFAANTVVLRNCTASNNRADFPVSDQISATGFRFTYPAGLTIVNCVSENNVCDLTKFTATSDFNAFAHGIFINSDRNFCNKFTNNVAIEGAKLSRNRIIANTQNVGYIFGESSGVRIRDDLCENIIIENSVITNNIPAFCEEVLNNK